MGAENILKNFTKNNKMWYSAKCDSDMLYYPAKRPVFKEKYRLLFFLLVIIINDVSRLEIHFFNK